MIQAREEEEILNEFLLLQLLSIEDTSIVNDLPKELDGCLGTIGFHEGHIQVIDKGNKSFIHG